MPGPPTLTGPFTMPMVKDFIPRRLQPWIYVVCAVIFQMETVYIWAACNKWSASGASCVRTSHS